MVICETCGKETDKVYRVVVDQGYNRSGAAPVYNCRECYERKNAERAAVEVERDEPSVSVEGETGYGMSQTESNPS